MRNFKKISVLISDDSQLKKNIETNKAMCAHFNRQGLKVNYFGLSEQKEIVSKYTNLENIIGEIDTGAFYHKGASITRNITYLKLKELLDKKQNSLFYFIDSDQEFKITVQGSNGDKGYYAINYFYYLDRIFREKNISILTGKVVGDPPVSPSVMAANFLDDLIFFITTASKLEPTEDCNFHSHSGRNADEASYHDMAELFGFKTKIECYKYSCTLEKKHNNSQSFFDFSKKINHFFDGEHPTRKSYFQYCNALTNIQPARTVYTGNYIFKPENLKYFIPFPCLKLRMAGPVLGRIIKSEINDQFVSANLPMLHKRTVDTIGHSEFRAGVTHEEKNTDLSGEFTRQFFGDVMLFSMIELTELGYPETSLTKETISIIISKTHLSLQETYKKKQTEILQKMETLKEIFNHEDNWWNKNNDMETAIRNFTKFIDNIYFNFSENALAYQSINSIETTNAYQLNILNAIISYSFDRSLWQTIMDADNK